MKCLRLCANTRGSSLIITYMLTTVLLVLGAAFVVLSTNERRVAERNRMTARTFHIAEAGIEQAILTLRNDFVNAVGSPSWDDCIYDTEDLSTNLECLSVADPLAITLSPEYAQIHEYQHYH